MRFNSGFKGLTITRKHLQSDSAYT